MIQVINDTKMYWNQYYDVTDIIKTPKNEKGRTCNITCVAMIVGYHPDRVLQDMFARHGMNDQFQWESNLTHYLEEHGHKCTEITKHAYPKARKITNDEIEKILGELQKGKVILYHKKGHYQLMVGYRMVGQVPEFIFNDPAGDRTKFVRNRAKESGHLVTYSNKKVKREKIYGSCWSVEI